MMAIRGTTRRYITPNFIVINRRTKILTSNRMKICFYNGFQVPRPMKLKGRLEKNDDRNLPLSCLDKESE